MDDTPEEAAARAQPLSAACPPPTTTHRAAAPRANGTLVRKRTSAWAPREAGGCWTCDQPPMCSVEGTRPWRQRELGRRHDRHPRGHATGPPVAASDRLRLESRLERISSIRAPTPATVARMPAPDAPAAKVSMDDLGEEPSVAPKAAWSLSSLLGLDKCCAPASVTVFAQQLEVTRHPRARLHWAVGAWLRARCR